MFNSSELTKFIFGRLTWDALPIHEPILLGTFVVVAIGGLAVLGLITYFRLWGYLWREWFTSIDHKKIGVMYIVLACDAAARLRRRPHDARAAGAVVRRPTTAICRRITTTRSSRRTA